MASHKVLLIAAAAMAVVVGALLPATTTSATDFMIGDFDGWVLNVVGYDDWDDWASKNRPFVVGDSLDFRYQQGSHDVVVLREDDEQSYSSCVVPNTVWPLDTGYDRVKLTEQGRYFFFCSNHCASGMKFAIQVLKSSDG